MDHNANSPARDESRIDLSLSWRMFLLNSKPFLATQGIAFGVLIGIAVGISGLLALFGLVTSSSSDIFIIVLQIPNLLVFYAFQGSLYGLAFDIMSSGDQFTELGETFRYLGKFWGRYLLFGLIYNMPTICLVIIGMTFGETAIAHMVEILLLFMPLSFIIYTIFVQAGPALTALGGVKEAFKDNFQTLRKIPRRMFKTWILFWGIFYLPYFITTLLILTQINAFIQGEITGLPALILAAIAQMWYYLAGVPVQTLVATRIYNSIHLKTQQNST